MPNESAPNRPIKLPDKARVDSVVLKEIVNRNVKTHSDKDIIDTILNAIRNVTAAQIEHKLEQFGTIELGGKDLDVRINVYLRNTKPEVIKLDGEYFVANDNGEQLERIFRDLEQRN